MPLPDNLSSYRCKKDEIWRVNNDIEQLRCLTFDLSSISLKPNDVKLGLGIPLSRKLCYLEET